MFSFDRKLRPPTANSRAPRAESQPVVRPDAGVVARATAHGGLFEPRFDRGLEVSHPEDESERQADRIADEVMRAPAPPSAEAAPLSRPAAPSALQKVLRAPGQPLDAETRRFMEPRFGQDFSQVRVHVDSEASTSAAALQARAYTVGHDIVFRQGEHTPGTTQGRRLLAHELAHVVQQGGALAGDGSRTSQARASALAGPVVQRQLNPFLMLSTWGHGGITVPQARPEDDYGIAHTETFSLPQQTTARIYAIATGPPDNRSDWSVILMRSTWWGDDEAVGVRHYGTCSGEISYDQWIPQDWSASYYLIFRNASHYNSIWVAWNVST